MKEIELEIKILGEPVLRDKVKLVQEITEYHLTLLSLMARLMYSAKGVGLAATQVGVSESLIVVDAGCGLYKLINPKIVKKEGSQVNEEGCLSIPGVVIKVKRARKIILEALDPEGKSVKIEAEGLLACVFQHEIDHLEGKLIVDYASFFDKLKLKKKLPNIL